MQLKYLSVLWPVIIIIYYGCVKWVWTSTLSKVRNIKIKFFVLFFVIFLPFSGAIIVHAYYYYMVLFWADVNVEQVVPVNGFAIVTNGESAFWLYGNSYIRYGYKYIERCDSFGRCVLLTDNNGRVESTPQKTLLSDYIMDYVYKKKFCTSTEEKRVYNTNTNETIATSRKVSLRCGFVPFSLLINYLDEGLEEWNSDVQVELEAIPPISNKKDL